MKKISLVLMLVLVMTLAISPLYVSAHSYGNSARHNGLVVSHTYENCAVETCSIAAQHFHNGKIYYGHGVDDGHEYHGMCGYDNCSLDYGHNHNGNYYLPNAIVNQPEVQYNQTNDVVYGSGYGHHSTNNYSRGCHR